MQSPVIAFILVVMTAALSLGAFVLYSMYFSGIQSTTTLQSSVIALSKYLQVQVSNYAFYYNTTGSYFNVSYLVWVQVPARDVVVVPFVVKPMNLSELYYYLPSGPQNASIFYSTPSGYVPVKPLAFSGQVYLPQGDQLLGSVNAVGYNVSPNNTYVLDTRLYPGEIIVVWILYYQEQWFRIGYTYIDPFWPGLGVYTVSSTGVYTNTSKIALTQGQSPHYFTSQDGFSFGLWFYPVLDSTVPATILNISFLATNKQNVSFIAYQDDGKLYLETIQLSPPYTVVKTFFYSLTPGNWYFLNVSYGSLVGSTSYFTVTLYNQSGVRLNYSSGFLPSYTELNGYYIAVTYGSSVLADSIPQAYFTSLQSSASSTALPAFYNVSTIMLRNGPYYNNTLLYNETIVNNAKTLYAIGFWYFVWPTSNPPNQIYGIFWYNPQGSYRYPLIYYFPEVGYNTYVIA